MNTMLYSQMEYYTVMKMNFNSTIWVYLNLLSEKKQIQITYDMMPFRQKQLKLKAYIVWPCVCIKQNYLLNK